MLIGFKNLLFICFFLAAGHAHAERQSYVAKHALLSAIAFCNQANLDLTQATQCDYQKSRKNTQALLTDGPLWIRVQVQSINHATSAVAIHLGPHFLSDLRLFEKKDGRWVQEEAGSHLAANDSHAEIGGYRFIAQTQANEVSTYYLRINASSLSNIFIVVEPWPSTNPYNHKLGIGMQFGALLLILIFALLSYWLSPSQVMLRFSLLMLTTLLSFAAGSGLLAHYLLTDKPALNQSFFSVFICLRLALWIGLARALLRPYQTPQWYGHACHATYGIVAISMLMIAYQYTGLAYGLIFITVLMAPLLQTLAIARTPGIAPSFKHAMMGGFLLQTLLIAILATVVKFSLAGSYFPIYIARMTDFIAPLVMLSIILFQQKLKNAELNQMKATLLEGELRSKFEQKQLAERSLLIDMLAHELKNPLTAIGMASGSLGHDLEKMGIKENRRLENIQLSVANMDRIIERCVLMNAVDRQEQGFYRETIDLRALLTRCIAGFDQADRVHLSMHAECSINTDAYLLEIAINNLIGNALKYSPPGSPIQINVLQPTLASENRTLICISNSIKAELAPDETALFERFYRHPLAHNISGSGLGLYISRGICQLLGGSISFNISGLTVSFTIELDA